VRWAIAIPQYVRDGTFDPGGLRAYLTRAEELGFESAWTQENVLGAMPVISPLELMSYAAACTERLRLGCAVFVSPLHIPLHLAKSLASLDQLSRGRVEVGLGVGGGFRDFAAFGLDNAHLATRFTEGLAMMKALWTEDAVTFAGRFWQTEGARMEPKPFQKPHPPVWFGGSHPGALRRTVRLADGFFGAGSTSTADFAAQVVVLRAELERVGRDPAGFPVAKRVYLAVDDDPDRARQGLATELDRLYGHFGLRDMEERVAVYGRPDTVVAGLRGVAAAGAELIQLNAMFDHTAQMERLAADVLPHL
jgi:probable F420-dependent oxidoreductase